MRDSRGHTWRRIRTTHASLLALAHLGTAARPIQPMSPRPSTGRPARPDRPGRPPAAELNRTGRPAEAEDWLAPIECHEAGPSTDLPDDGREPDPKSLAVMTLCTWRLPSTPSQPRLFNPVKVATPAGRARSMVHGRGCGTIRS